MEFRLAFPVNEHLYLKDPESTELGRKLVKNSVEMIYSLGFEQFTFKKLSIDLGTTEATVYRYFENKHRLLLYIINWYWLYLDYSIDFHLNNISDSKQKIITIIKILTNTASEIPNHLDYNKEFLNKIIINESSKAYLTKEVEKINKEDAFKPYKELCAKIAAILIQYNPRCKYPKSLSTTMIETAHHQQFFSEHLPRLTDASPHNCKEFSAIFLTDLVFKALQ